MYISKPTEYNDHVSFTAMSCDHNKVLKICVFINKRLKALTAIKL